MVGTFQPAQVSSSLQVAQTSVMICCVRALGLQEFYWVRGLHEFGAQLSPLLQRLSRLQADVAGEPAARQATLSPL